MAQVDPRDQRAAGRVDGGAAIEGAAAAILPGACDGRQAGGGEKLRAAVARAREAVADADEAAARAAVKPREFADRLLGKAGDARSPGRIAGRPMRDET